MMLWLRRCGSSAVAAVCAVDHLRFNFGKGTAVHEKKRKRVLLRSCRSDSRLNALFTNRILVPGITPMAHAPPGLRGAEGRKFFLRHNFYPAGFPVRTRTFATKTNHSSD